MDPNETLRLIGQFGPHADDRCDDLMGWLDRGGFEPVWVGEVGGTSYFLAWLAQRMNEVGRRRLYDRIVATMPSRFHRCRSKCSDTCPAPAKS